jgi:hypothetical protein
MMSANRTGKDGRGFRRRVALRVAMVGIGVAGALALILMIEVALRICDVGHERGLFAAVPASDGTPMLRLAWNPQFNKPVEPQPYREFLADKPPHSFRIFVIGESSAEGVPYGTGTSRRGWRSGWRRRFPRSVGRW